MILFSGTSHPKLAEAISKKYKLKLGFCEIKKFFCNETYVRLDEDVRGKICYILQTCTANVNHELMEIFLLADALRRNDAKEIRLIIPNYGYARQDRIAEHGETISAKLVAALLEMSGVSKVITFDLHSDQIQGFFSIPVNNLKCYSLFAEYFKKKKLTDVVVVAPDASAAKISKRLGDLIGAPIAILHKYRPGHHKAAFTHIAGEVKGKTAILFDDMIDTASTTEPACKVLRKAGAGQVYVAVTHPIFSGPAYQRLEAIECKEIVVTDTVPIDKHALNNVKVLSVVDLLEKVI